MSCFVLSCDSESCSRGLHSHFSFSESADPLLKVTDGSTPTEQRVLEVWERHLFSVDLEHAKMTTHRRPPTPQHVNADFFHLVQLEWSNVQRDGEGSQEPCCSNLFPCQLHTPLLEFDVIHPRHPQHPSLSFTPPFPHLFLFLSFFHVAVREDAWFMKLYFYQLPRRKKGGEKQWQRESRRKRIEEWRVWRAGPRGRRTGAWGEDIHHPATIGWKWRWEVGWDRNMMDLTKIRWDMLQRTRVVYYYWTQLGA